MCWRNGGAMLKAHIIKKRRELTVDVSLELERGQSVGLFGASGAGKSTVLACIAGIEEPDGGLVTLDNLQFFPPSRPLHLRRLGSARVVSKENSIPKRYHKERCNWTPKAIEEADCPTKQRLLAVLIIIFLPSLNILHLGEWGLWLLRLPHSE